VRSHFIVHERALLDLNDMADRIAKGSLDAALRFLDAARRTFKMIEDFLREGAMLPIEGRADLAGLRLWPIRKFRAYVVCYLEREGEVEIIRVIHGARDIARVI